MMNNKHKKTLSLRSVFRRCLRYFTLAILTTVVLSGCGSGGEDGGGGGSGTSGGGSSGTTTTMAVIASATVGPAGGVVADQWQETVVRVPAGAVAQDTMIEIRRGFDAEGHIVTDIVSSADTGPVEITLPDPALLAANTPTDVVTALGVTANSVVAAVATAASGYPITEPADAANFSCEKGLGEGWFRRCARFLFGHRINDMTVTATLSSGGVQAAGFNALFSDKPAASLSSDCAFRSTECYGGKQPVLFVHGYANVVPTWFGLGGGEGTFGKFPNLVKNAGYLPFEFRWNTDARFEDVARDLGVAIAQISRETGMKVHIVAHSFGGVLARTYLQGLAGPWDTSKVATLTTLGTPHSGVFDSIERVYDVDLGYDVTFGPGRDRQGIAFGSALDSCGQLSCYQTGADVGPISSAYDAGKVHGKIAALLASGGFTSEVYVQSLIGLTTCRGDDSDNLLDEGDGLISYVGQRFRPSDTADKAPSDYLPLRRGEYKMGAGWVSEAVLGSGDVNLKPGGTNLFSAPARGGYTHNNPSDPVCNGAEAIEMVKPDTDGFIDDGASVEHAGWAAVRGWLRAHPATPIVSATVSITGKIQNAATAAPVERAIVWIDSGSPSRVGVFSGPDGTFTANVEFRPYTKYSVEVQARGFRPATFPLGTTTSSPLPIDAYSLQIAPVSTTPPSFGLIVDIRGTGDGDVTGMGITCPTHCMENYTAGTSVRLDAQAGNGSIFVGWSGCARTDGMACYLNMNNNVSVTANFAATANAAGVPMAPTALSATALSQTNVALIWQDNAVSESGFEVERKLGLGGTYTRIAQPGPSSGIGSGVYFEDTGLTAGTQYCYQVRALNAGGYSSYTSESCVTMQSVSTAPRITVGPASLNFGNVSVGVCGTTVTFAIQHVLGTNPASGTVSVGPNPPFSILAGGSFSVSNGSAANVSVQFCPSSPLTYTGTATVTSSATFTGTNTVTLSGTGTTTITLPAAPSTLTANTLSQNIIALTWKDNSDNETGFKIERKTGTSGTFAQIATVGSISGIGSGGYYENIGLTAATTYCYRTRAFNTAGDSLYTSESCAATQAAVVMPSATTGIATNIASNSVTLNGVVNPNGVATGAFFQWGTTTSYGNTTSSQVVGSGTTPSNVGANLTGLAANTTYHFRIVATNSSGGTVFGADQSFTTASTPSTTPTVISVSPNTLTQGTGAQYVTITGAYFTSSSYHQFSNNAPGSWYDPQIAPTINNSTSMTVTVNTSALAAGTVVYIRVCASQGSSACSGSVAVTIQAAAAATPTAPSGLVALAAPSFMSLAWNDNSSNETGFTVERKTGASGSWSQIASVGQNIAAYLDYGVSAGVTYYYRVSAYNASGNSGYSNEAYATIAAALTVNGFAPSYSTTTTPYQPTIYLTGSGFNSVTQISWSCTMPNGTSCTGSPYVWTPGTTGWSKFGVTSDTAAWVAPTLLATGDPVGTYAWTVTFSGAGVTPVTKLFTVTKN